ncbi:hypothetical protein QOT17_018401 [Balamuthia mandrillaris]
MLPRYCFLLLCCSLCCLLCPLFVLAAEREDDGVPMPEPFRLERNPYQLHTGDLEVRIQAWPEPSPSFLLIPKNESGHSQSQYWFHFEVVNGTVPALNLLLPWDLKNWLIEQQNTTQWDQIHYEALGKLGGVIGITHTVTKENVTLNLGGRSISIPRDTFKYSLSSLGSPVPDGLEGLAVMENFRIMLSHPVVQESGKVALPDYRELFRFSTRYFTVTYVALNFSVNNGDQIGEVNHLYPWHPIRNEKDEVMGFELTAQIQMAVDIEYDPSISVVIGGASDEASSESEDDDSTLAILIGVLVPCVVIATLVILVVLYIHLRRRKERQAQSAVSVKPSVNF